MSKSHEWAHVQHFSIKARGPATVSKPYQPAENFGVLGVSVDAAIAVFRERNPDHRIEAVNQVGPVHYIANDPRVVEICNRLSGVDE